ncbi:MAG: glycosyltransferase family 4 protein [Patescibacteria group bacterium]|nr:glycosyltransferase family 4 protein [Patescibacteria group bacterium]MDI6821533.1 glycosyltransferase family 4 protein [Actinomycetota bacterium]
MKLVFIARNYPPDVGGAEKLNYDLACNLSKHLDLKVISNNFGKYSPLFYIYAFLKLFLLWARRDVDTVFLSDALLSPLIPFLKIFRKPVVVKVHGLDITYPNRVYQSVVPRFTNMANKIICISEATREECLRRGIKADKCSVITVGIDFNEFYLDGDRGEFRRQISKIIGIDLTEREILLSVGRLVERKGFHWFIENIMPKLIEKRREILYLIAGDGVMKERIEESIREKTVQDYVLLLGEVNVDTLKLLYNASDIFIMPNIKVKGDMEGFGIVALEASSCALPVIASRLEGIQNAIEDGCNGFLVEPYNISDYVNRINELIDNDQKRKDFGERAREFTLGNFGWEGIAKEYFEEFWELIQGENN